MKQADEIKKMYEQAGIDTLGSSDNAVLEQMKNAYSEQNQASPETARLDTGRKIMASRILKIAVAAVVIIAAVVGLNLLGLLGKGQATWADVIKPIFTAQTARFDITVGEGEGAMVITDTIKGSRINRKIHGFEQSKIILDLETSKVITIDDDEKTAVYVDLENFPSIPNYLELLQNLITKLQDSEEFEVEQLGEKSIDGRQAVGFLATCPGVEIMIWADPETAVPFRIEQVETNLKIVCSNFEFDIPLDDSLFSMEIPQGYQEQTMQLDLTGSTEEDFIAGLKTFAEISPDKKFLPDISIEYITKNAVQIGEMIENTGLSTDEQMGMGKKLGQMMLFLRFFNKYGEGQWYYAGDGVKLGDVAKPIFWYQPKESETWRVIYGDLSVKDVNEEDLPN